MKKKELNELRGSDLKVLTKLVSDKRRDLVKTKVDMSVSKEKNLKKVKLLRHDVAQLLTLIKETKLIEGGTEEIEVEESKKKDKKEVKK